MIFAAYLQIEQWSSWSSHIIIGVVDTIRSYGHAVTSWLTTTRVIGHSDGFPNDGWCLRSDLTYLYIYLRLKHLEYLWWYSEVHGRKILAFLFMGIMLMNKVIDEGFLEWYAIISWWSHQGAHCVWKWLLSWLEGICRRFVHPAICKFWIIAHLW